MARVSFLLRLLCMWCHFGCTTLWGCALSCSQLPEVWRFRCGYWSRTHPWLWWSRYESQLLIPLCTCRLNPSYSIHFRSALWQEWCSYSLVDECLSHSLQEKARVFCESILWLWDVWISCKHNITSTPSSTLRFSFAKKLLSSLHSVNVFNLTC